MPETATKEELQSGRAYETLFVPALFAPWPRHVLDGAEFGEGADVLDVACGTGVLTRAARARSGVSGRIVGLDAAPGMIGAAEEISRDIEWVVGSAEDLPFADASFDAVVSQFGLMFFQDRLQAAREIYRVTRTGGSLAVAVWRTIEENPAYGDIVSVLDEHVSPEAAKAVTIPFCLGDPEQVTTMFDEAGFTDIKAKTKSEQAEFPSTRTMVEVELRGWLPLFGINLGEDKIADVLKKSDAKLSKYATPLGKGVFSTSAYIVTARKPE